MSSSLSTVPVGANVVVLRGLLRKDPEYRVLASGEEQLSFDLSIRDGDRTAESVPVAWQNPPTSARTLSEGVDVVVIGRVRRRFFRSGGATVSRTAVDAETVLSARSTARLRAALIPLLEPIVLG